MNIFEHNFKGLRTSDLDVLSINQQNEFLAQELCLLDEWNFIQLAFCSEVYRVRKHDPPELVVEDNRHELGIDLRPLLFQQIELTEDELILVLLDVVVHVVLVHVGLLFVIVNVFSILRPELRVCHM